MEDTTVPLSHVYVGGGSAYAAQTNVALFPSVTVRSTIDVVMAGGTITRTNTCNTQMYSETCVPHTNAIVIHRLQLGFCKLQLFHKYVYHNASNFANPNQYMSASKLAVTTLFGHFFQM